MDLQVQAYHIGKRIIFSQDKPLFREKAVKSDSTYRLYKNGGDSYIYLKDFGAIVFVNCPEAQVSKILSDFGSAEERFHEVFVLNVDERNEMRADFDKIYIPSIDIDLMHIICLNIAQSLALDQYQNEVDVLLEKTRIMTKNLERTGRIDYSRRKLARFIGEIMNLRSRIADNLYIFEAPPLAWKEATLSEMDEVMNREFDFRNRHMAVQHSLSVVRDIHEFLNNLLQHKHSSLLEWIIIILILFEVVHIFIK